MKPPQIIFLLLVHCSSQKNIVVICSTSCMGGGVSDNFLGIAASLSRFTSINKQHLKIAFCWCISRVLTARRDFTAGASAGVLSGQTTQAESRTIDIALYVQCVISLSLISLSLNVSLSPKLGLRPKISQKVKSFFRSDSAIRWAFRWDQTSYLAMAKSKAIINGSFHFLD